MTGMDSLSDIILSSVKVSSENTENTALFLTDIKKRYGIPTACVHDMGTGICRAVNEVFPGVHDYICHFHFLRDIGKDYLEPAYQVLRHCLQQHAASSKLHAIAREVRQELGAQADEAALLADAIKQDSRTNSGLLPQAWA
jgi:transposase-like protein